MCNGAPCEKTRSISIEGEMTIYRAAEAKRRLFGAVDDACVITLDLSNVTEIDTTGLQLIMLTKVMAEAKGGRLTMVQCSPCVLDVIELLGLSDYFHDAMPLTGESGSCLPDDTCEKAAYAA